MQLIGAEPAVVLPPQLRDEFALVRRDVEALYASRRRFLERFALSLEQRRAAHAAATGVQAPWQDETVRDLANRQAGITGALSLFLVAMITQGVCRCRRRVPAGGGRRSDPSRRLVDDLHTDLTRDYLRLHDKVSSLARPDIGVAEQRKLIGVDRIGFGRSLSACGASPTPWTAAWALSFPAVPTLSATLTG